MVPEAASEQVRRVGNRFALVAAAGELAIEAGILNKLRLQARNLAAAAPALTDVFYALADPTRRAIFEKLAAGSMNASGLRRGMAISQPAMSQHLAVLRTARLVREQRQGRFVQYEVDPAGLAQVARWLAKYRAWWPARIAALQSLLKDMDP